MADRFTAQGGQSTGASATETALVVTASSTRMVKITRIRVSQKTHKTSEQYELRVQRASAAGSGGSSITPSPKEVNGGASGATVSSGPTSEPTYTSNTIQVDVNWNSMVGKDIILTDDQIIWVPVSGIIGFIVLTPSGTTTFTPTVEVDWEEIG